MRIFRKLSKDKLTVLEEEVRLDVGKMVLVGGIQFSYQGEGESMPPWNATTNPSYDVLNIQAGIQKGPWEFMLNLDNATDEDYYTDLEVFPK